MAWCMNSECGKKNLSKTQVEFDDAIQMVLCFDCYAARHPGWYPKTDTPVVLYPSLPPGPPQWNYEVSLSSRDGFRARVAYGDVSLGLHAPPDDLRRLLGFKIEERVS